MAMNKSFDQLSKDGQILEVVRQRTNNLTKNLEGYFRQAFESGRENFENTALPDWNDINKAELNFINSIKALTDFLDDKQLDSKKQIVEVASGEKREFLEETSVFANEKFPYMMGYGDNVMLYELLRRRPDPQVSAWVQRMEGVGAKMEEGVVVEGEMVTDKEWIDLWNNAAMDGQMIFQQIYHGEEPAGEGDQGGDEDEDEDEDEDDEDEEMVDEKGKELEVEAQMPLAHVLSYMSNGYVPPP
jgi:hypothetical protein